MKIRTTSMHNRQGWLLDNDVLALFLMKGGGHIADLRLKGIEKINPFWAPPWKSIEPWKYKKSDAERYGVKLLASIYGHNLCLSAFGDPSPDEVKCGLSCHYEAPVTSWSVIRRKIGARRLSLEYGCVLPAAQMRVMRAVILSRGSSVIRVRESIQNLARRDVPFTMCQHVSFGPPFLETDVTAFDASATKGHTFPGQFGDRRRLKADKSYQWPQGPALHGKIDHASRVVNLRFMGKGRYGDFHANLMNPRKESAWFSAVNPRLGLMVACVWRRADYPWLGVWEENCARTQAPWNGKTLARGMEFANSPFPIGLRQAVDMGKLQGQRTYAWLPARGTVVHEYSLLALRVVPSCKGVEDIVPDGDEFKIKFLPPPQNNIIVR